MPAANRGHANGSPPLAKALSHVCQATGKACLWTSATLAMLALATYWAMVHVPCVPVMGSITSVHTVITMKSHMDALSEVCIVGVSYVTHDQIRMHNTMNVPMTVCHHMQENNDNDNDIIISYAALNPTLTKHGMPEVSIITLHNSLVVILAGMITSAYIGAITQLTRFALFLFGLCVF